MGKEEGRENRPEEDLGQQHEFIFEACKHLTTLDTAAALVVLALHRDAGWYLTPLPFFGVSLIAATYGMLEVALDLDPYFGQDRERGSVSLVLAAMTFVGGVFMAFLGAYNVWGKTGGGRGGPLLLHKFDAMEGVVRAVRSGLS